MSRARWTQPAQDDLAAIDEYYAGFDSTVADRIGRAAVAASRFLADHPAADAEVSAGWRRWRVANTPYLLLYRLVPSGIEILRVHHERQDWPFE